ncbi:MAG: tautomerase family protein, partial [Alphaproteobacteria bacterium]|nr:tautomerase family protein [Alphaproteobacteria bacterium]
ELVKELVPIFAKIIKMPEETIYVFINEYDAENVGVGHKLLCDLHKN